MNRGVYNKKKFTLKSNSQGYCGSQTVESSAFAAFLVYTSRPQS